MLSKSMPSQTILPRLQLDSNVLFFHVWLNKIQKVDLVKELVSIISSGMLKMSFKVICCIIHSKTCQLLKEIVLYILNTLENSWKKRKKVLENPGFHKLWKCTNPMYVLTLRQFSKLLAGF